MSGVDVTSWPSGAIDVESPELGISCSELGVGSSVRPKSRTDFAFQHLSTGVAPFYTNLLATPINASRSAGLFRAAPPAAGRSVLHDDRGPPSAKIILVHRTPPTSGYSPGRLHELTRRDARRMADHARELALSTKLHAQDAETRVLIVERHSFHPARQDLGRIGRAARPHVACPGVARRRAGLSGGK